MDFDLSTKSWNEQESGKIAKHSTVLWSRGKGKHENWSTWGNGVTKWVGRHLKGERRGVYKSKRSGKKHIGHGFLIATKIVTFLNVTFPSVYQPACNFHFFAGYIGTA
jgi:hypothetical protein